MTGLKQIGVTQWLCILGIILIVYMGRLMLAQNETPEATPEVMLTATEMTPVPDDLLQPVETTSQPLLESVPTESALPAESLLLTATDGPEATEAMVAEVTLSTEEATPEVTPVLISTDILLPTATNEPASPDATSTAEEMGDESALPTAEVLQPTVISPLPSLLPAVENIRLIPDEVNAAVNGTHTVTVFADGLENIYSVVLVCQVNPGVLSGIEARPGELLPSEQVMILDNGFQPDGRWVLAATYHNFTSGLQGTGALWHLDYRTGGSGLTSVVCEVQMTDQDGHPLPLVTTETVVVIENLPTATMIPPTAEVLNEEIEILLPTIDSTPTSEGAAEAVVDTARTPDTVDPYLIVQSYGLTVPPADPAIDLNADGIINIYDLVLASAG